MGLLVWKTTRRHVDLTLDVLLLTRLIFWIPKDTFFRIKCVKFGLLLKNDQTVTVGLFETINMQK